MALRKQLHLQQVYNNRLKNDINQRIIDGKLVILHLPTSVIPDFSQGAHLLTDSKMTKATMTGGEARGILRLLTDFIGTLTTMYTILEMF